MTSVLVREGPSLGFSESTLQCCVPALAPADPNQDLCVCIFIQVRETLDHKFFFINYKYYVMY